MNKRYKNNFLGYCTCNIIHPQIKQLLSCLTSLILQFQFYSFIQLYNVYINICMHCTITQALIDFILNCSNRTREIQSYIKLFKIFSREVVEVAT